MLELPKSPELSEMQDKITGMIVDHLKEQGDPLTLSVALASECAGLLLAAIGDEDIARLNPREVINYTTDSVKTPFLTAVTLMIASAITLKSLLVVRDHEDNILSQLKDMGVAEEDLNLPADEFMEKYGFTR